MRRKVFHGTYKVSKMARGPQRGKIPECTAKSDIWGSQVLIATMRCHPQYMLLCTDDTNAPIKLSGFLPQEHKASTSLHRAVVFTTESQNFLR